MFLSSKIPNGMLTVDLVPIIFLQRHPSRSQHISQHPYIAPRSLHQTHVDLGLHQRFQPSTNKPGTSTCIMSTLKLTDIHISLKLCDGAVCMSQEGSDWHPLLEICGELG